MLSVDEFLVQARYMEQRVRESKQRYLQEHGLSLKHATTCKGETCSMQVLDTWPATIDGKEYELCRPLCRALHDSGFRGSLPRDLAFGIAEDLGRTVLAETRGGYHDLYGYCSEHDIPVHRYEGKLVPFVKTQVSAYFFKEDVDRVFADELKHSSRTAHQLPTIVRDIRRESQLKAPRMVLRSSQVRLLCRPGVYVFWRGTECLYVGLGRPLLPRAFSASHHRAAAREAATHVELRFCEDNYEAQELEQMLISKLEPVLNNNKNPLTELPAELSRVGTAWTCDQLPLLEPDRRED